MKEQNLRILKELEWFRKKAPMTDPNLGEGARASVVQAAAELPEQDSENFRQPRKKKMKTMIILMTLMMNQMSVIPMIRSKK